MTREQAKGRLACSPYPDPDDLQVDIEYFLKKMGWSERDLADYLARPERAHNEFPSEAGLYARLLQLQKRFLVGW